MTSQYFRIQVENDRNQPGTPKVPATTAINQFRAGDSLIWEFDESLLKDEKFAPTVLSPNAAFTRMSVFGNSVVLEGFEDFLDPCAPQKPLRFDYHAALVPRGEDWRLRAVNRSNRASVTLTPANRQGTFEAGKRIRVTVRAELAGSGSNKSIRLPLTLALDPPNLSIMPGETAVFDFNISADFFGQNVRWIPEVAFPGNQPILGPFENVTSFLDAPAQVVLSGDSGQRGSFGYLVRIRTVDGLMALSSDDPAIDNDGELVGPISPSIRP